MKLSTEQIQKLYTFTRQHYVEYYDLQTELVDHLANAIEEHWQENPKLSFDEALQMEFKKFGVFGFMDVVEKRQKYLNTKYNKLVWKHFKDFFQIPRIVFSIIGFGFFYKFVSVTDYQIYVIFGFAAIFMIIVFFKTYLAHQKLKVKFKETQKKWLFEEVIFRFGSLIAILQIPLQIIIKIGGISEANNMNTIYILLFCGITFLLFVVSYIILFVIPSKAEEYLKETYPEYEFSN
jgi:hypothetical protein